MTTGWKRSVFLQIPKKGSGRECSNYHIIVLISHASKDMLKILQARLQQYMNLELSALQSGFRKGRGTSNQIANICWIIDWFQIGQGVCQDCILLPCLFKLYAEYIMGNAGWMTHKTEVRLQREISSTSDSR